MLNNFYTEFSLNPYLRSTCLLILGLIIGSFLNVVIYRLPLILEREWYKICAIDHSLTPSAINLCHPGSHCINCKHTLPWYLNIPLISFIISQAHCIYCKAHISWRYPLIEGLSGILFLLLGLHFDNSLQLLAGLIFISLILVLIVIDFNTMILPDQLTLSLLWLGIIINYHGLFAGNLQNAILGAIGGYSFLWLTYWIFKLITHREGMGYGDFKLLAAILAWFGIYQIFTVLILASLTGIIYYTILKVLQKIDKNEAIAFGPFLGFAGLILLFFTDFILKILLP